MTRSFEENPFNAKIAEPFHLPGLLKRLIHGISSLYVLTNKKMIDTNVSISTRKRVQRSFQFS